MLLASLLVCQRHLRRRAQIPALAAAVRAGRELPPVQLVLDGEGRHRIHDGHHRATAYVLAGRTHLQPWEYVVLPLEPRPAFGTLAELAGRSSLTG